MKKMIGDMIRFHRKKAGISQKELADLAELGKTVIFDLEKGRSNSRIDTLLKILNVLNIRLEFKSPLIEMWRKQYEKDNT